MRNGWLDAAVVFPDELYPWRSLTVFAIRWRSQ